MAVGLMKATYNVAAPAALTSITAAVSAAGIWLMKRRLVLE
jgi:hypothetical protein